MTESLRKKISDVLNENQNMKIENKELQIGIINTLTTSNLIFDKVVLNRFVLS